MPSEMSKYFFNVRQGNVLFEDRHGADFPDIAAAWNWAIQDVRTLVAQNVLDGQPEEQWLEIGDRTGAIVASVPFTRVLRLH
jgi:hypothetical protein